jgi:hypothetical protein
MDTLEELRAQRFAFLQTVFDAAGGSTSAALRLYEIGAQVGFDDDLTRDVAGYLAEEDLIEWIAQGFIRLAHRGRKEIEQALSEPEEPTEHFLPLVVTQNYISIGSMTGSQIQQGTVDSSQTMGVADSVVSEMIDALTRAADEADDPETKSRLRRAAETLGGIARSVVVDAATKALTKYLPG